MIFFSPITFIVHNQKSNGVANGWGPHDVNGGGGGHLCNVG